jgi:EmrB/QacA subfamily drug resistance transporter
MTTFMIPYMASSINVALPTIGKELNMKAITLSWVATSYLLSSCVVLLSFGRLADILGRKKIFIWGLIVYTSATLFCSFSANAAQLILSRVLQGIGSSMIYATSLAILTSAFPKEERGRVMGYYAATVYIGLSTGPFIGGLLTQLLGWRSVFYVTVPLGILAIIFTILKIKTEWREAEGEAFDFPGAIVFALAIFSIIYGITRLPALRSIIIMGFGIISLVFFGIIESRSKSPLIDIKIFKKNRVFVYSSLAALINYSATFAISFLLAMYLQFIKGFNPQTAGIVLIAQPIVQVIVSPVAGRLSDRTEPLKIASSGMIITAAALFMFSFLNDTTDIIFIIASLAFSGLGMGLFSSPNSNAIMSSINKEVYGVASSVLASMRVLGQNLSLGISMVIFTIMIGDVQITADYYPEFITSTSTIFLILAGLCTAGIFLSLARGKVRN